MQILVAEVIRSYSQVLSYNENADPIYKRLKTKNLSGGFPPLTNLIDGRISGWKMQKNDEGVKMFEELKAHVEKDAPEPALTLYKATIIPFLKKGNPLKPVQ